MIPGLAVVFLHPARIVIRSVVGPDRVIVNVQELSAPVTDLTYPCYRGNFLHHRHLFGSNARDKDFSFVYIHGLHNPA